MALRSTDRQQLDSAEKRLARRRQQLPRAAPALGRGRMPIIESECSGADCAERVEHLGSVDPPLCEGCETARLVHLETERRERQVALEADRVARIRDNLPEHLAAAGAPVRYRQLTRAAWEAAYKPWTDQTMQSIEGETLRFTEICEHWVQQARPLQDWLLVLFGKHGRRKTGLGTAVLGEALCAGKRGLWVDAEAWVDALEWGLREPSRPARGWRPTADVYRHAAFADYLLLDDLGAVRAGRTGARASQDWWKERLALLLREREAWARPTVVTSNMERLDELAHINHSLPSRLSVRLAFKIAGRDYRRKETER